MTRADTIAFATLCAFAAQRSTDAAPHLIVDAMMRFRALARRLAIEYERACNDRALASEDARGAHTAHCDALLLRAQAIVAPFGFIAAQNDLRVGLYASLDDLRAHRPIRF